MKLDKTRRTKNFDAVAVGNESFYAERKIQVQRSIYQFLASRSRWV